MKTTFYFFKGQLAGIFTITFFMALIVKCENVMAQPLIKNMSHCSGSAATTKIKKNPQRIIMQYKMSNVSTSIDDEHNSQ